MLIVVATTWVQPLGVERVAKLLFVRAAAIKRLPAVVVVFGQERATVVVPALAPAWTLVMTDI